MQLSRWAAEIGDTIIFVAAGGADALHVDRQTDYLHARAWTIPGAEGAEDQQMKITERKGRPWKKAGPSLSQI